MTNTELQMVGIDEAAFNAASEERRISWAKHNTTGGVGLCDAAALWLQSHASGVGVVTEFGMLGCCGKVNLDDLGIIYRLAPDYQPPVKRWWFDTANHKVIYLEAVSPSAHSSYIEVTAEYAAYLQAKPDGEWELRKVATGDTFMPTDGDEPCEWFSYEDFPYRWCKPRKVAGWREYEVMQRDGAYFVDFGYCWRPLFDAANRVGFGGVRFDRGINEDRWFMITAKLADGDGLYESGMDYETNTRPATPVLARFWEVPK